MVFNIIKNDFDIIENEYDCFIIFCSIYFDNINVVFFFIWLRKMMLWIVIFVFENLRGILIVFENCIEVISYWMFEVIFIFVESVEVFNLFVIRGYEVYDVNVGFNVVFVIL